MLASCEGSSPQTPVNLPRASDDQDDDEHDDDDGGDDVWRVEYYGLDMIIMGKWQVMDGRVEDMEWQRVGRSKMWSLVNPRQPLKSCLFCTVHEFAQFCTSKLLQICEQMCKVFFELHTI